MSLPFASSERERSIIERWQRVVEKFPLQCAVTTVEGAKYTYQELDQHSTRLANALNDAFGTGNHPILLLLEHSYALVVGILGAIKANKAYVYLDPIMATGQLQLIVESVASPLVVTADPFLDIARAITTTEAVWSIDALPATSEHPRPLSFVGDEAAAILFTSGTTMQAKGVVYTHRMLLHFVWLEHSVCPLGPDDSVSGLRTCGLGAGLKALFHALLTGATYALYPIRQHGLQRLSTWLQDEQITYFHPPIVLFRQWLETLTTTDFFPALRYILPSGRKTREDLGYLWPHVPDSCVVLTSYSVTEATLISARTIDRYTPVNDGVLDVGLPLPDKGLIILDSNGEPVVTGQIGEIIVRSRYIASGYWRQPDLTAQRFKAADDGSGETIYHTGDYGRFRDDGYLELVGRQDSQIKLRGYRVVLDEVEDALRSLSSVQEAAVSADEERGLLFAYVVASQSPPPSPSALRAALAEKLPHYALPNQIIFLPHFPLLPSGKVNRRALPAPELNRTGLTTPFMPPRNEIETQLAAIWEDLFAIHPIGVADNFFDLGGHSILSMRLLHAVEQQFQRSVALRDFVFNPTIAHIAALLSPETGQASSKREESAAPSSLLDNAELRALYDALEDKAKIDELRTPLRVKPPLPRPLRLLLRLPQPVAMSLLYRVVQQPWVQQHYMQRQSAQVQRFFAGLEDAPAQQSLGWLTSAVARSLFFGALTHFGLRQTIFPQLQATNKIPIGGLDALDTARSRQQGVILLVSHNYQAPYFRTFRLTQGWIGNMTLLTSNQPFNKVHAEHILYARQLELARQTLQKGQTIYIAPDVYQGHGTSITVQFHGRMHPFRTSFADLALLTDAQIFFVASDLQAYDRFSFELIGPFDMGTSAMRYDDRVQHLMDQYVAHLRQQWARNPWALPWWLMREHLGYPPVEVGHS